ncbi:type IV secretion system protein VirB10 [Bartonella sp. WD12.1]|uniref:type IV secretion system protein VirB10 n=1 Tax=Bartonella sp. WD12.1 TaxID=1933903 RepID=UPI000999A6B8|nr:type IV secretion system protein VirB10 [Bartonella sp. WD12.1]OPB28417.1 type IV secretion system protein VirB10 [Bartonella sp. WD12.1]
MSDNNDEIIAEDRGKIDDNQNSISSETRKKVIIGLAFLGFGAYMLWNILSTSSTQDDIEKEPKKEVQSFNTSLTPLELAPPEPKPQIGQITLPAPTPPTEDIKDDPLFDAARRAPVLAFASEAHSQNNKTKRNNLSEITEIFNKDSQNFSALLKPTKTEETKAGLLGNRNFIIAMGTSIPCILETAISSDQPGFTSCVINRDILSDNGRVVLLDKGTQIVGEYRGGLKKGQHRLFVLWTRAKTPNGVIVTLASPATDNLGRSGFDGTINTHWWERFGSALLLSIVDNTSANLSGQISDNIQIAGTNNLGKDAASIALENQINIPPTLEKNQGELVNIFVARDLDFSSVYKLAVTEKENKVFTRSAPSNFFLHSPYR